MTGPRTSTEASAFAAGTFTPRPEAAAASQMLAAQILMETKLILRHGEQLLLTLFIPVVLLVALSTIDLGFIDSEPSRIANVAPFVLAVAAMSTGFTGQAIAVAFDRRYGALKRLGSTALPRWVLIGGKIGAVATVTALQVVLLGLLAVILGWRPGAGAGLLVFVVVMVGAIACTALGLLIGGTLRAEVVLALANLLWIVLLGFAGIMLSAVGGIGAAVARFTPSGALVEATSLAAGGGFPAVSLAIVLLWGIVAGAAAARWFSFTG